MRLSRLLLLASFVLAPFPARAADVPVTYTVDTTALKAAISGTNLTFNLFTDAACTATAHTQVLTIDNTTLQSVLKRSKPKNGVKPPKTTDIRATLTGVGPAAPLYLTVTGTGVTAVGGACQVQAAAIAGTGGGAVVKDGLGNVMGPSLDGASFLVPVGPDLVRLPVAPSGYVYSGYLYYGGSSCTGQVYSYVQPGLYKVGVAVDTTQFYVTPTSGLSNLPWAAILQIDQNVFNSQGDCDSGYGVGNATFVAPHACCCDTVCAGGPGLLAPGTLQILPTFTPPFSLDVP